jgi:GT2 family glycosyltransferase
VKADGARQLTASVLVPTRARPDYLDVTLRSIVPQAQASGAEVIVISDGEDPSTAAVARAHQTRLVTLEPPAGANAARNAGIAAAAGELVVLVDDDIEAPPGWLEALLAGAREEPAYGVFGGPIRARLEGGGPRACGRETAPITTLELGSVDADAEFVWSANMAVRAGELARTGPFNERIHGRGEEEEWLERYRGGGGRIRYLASAGVDHRRTAPDCGVRALMRAQYALGRTARRNDVRKGTAPALSRELRTLAGCAWHVIRRLCAVGVVLAAHSYGRIRELADPSPIPTDDFLSGQSGYVIRATARTVAADGLLDAVNAAALRALRLRRSARSTPRRRVLVLGIERLDAPNLMAAARTELARSRHEVTVITAAAGEGGKFSNLNALLAENPPDLFEWLLVIDDDVSLPARFLDSFIFLAERFDLRLAQPAHRRRSHAAWRITRRRAFSVARETAFVEIGPVTAFHRTTFAELLPFPPLRAGWGLDAHWSAIARRRGWRIGVIDATPIEHRLRPVAAAYDRNAAIDEAREFLRDRPYVRAADAQRTLVTHRSW